MMISRLSQVATAASASVSRNTTAVLGAQSNRTFAGPPPPPKKIECFIDGKKVLVDPGTTVLQVKGHYSRHVGYHAIIPGNKS